MPGSTEIGLVPTRLSTCMLVAGGDADAKGPFTCYITLKG